ncbi:hypothetical protein IE53DRAFT_244170 [Violaceomyces palustris]|uniref:Uncharacterized protein n=1 Tax=Violaceomyces palustris TaxID=1673888 RepID=A0ACD0NP52_9BASI|nr:hypothetical protein IE53DRAFT_244170 [Violaceomyces palustris]
MTGERTLESLHVLGWYVSAFILPGFPWLFTSGGCCQGDGGRLETIINVGHVGNHVPSSKKIKMKRKTRQRKRKKKKKRATLWLQHQLQQQRNA